MGGPPHGRITFRRATRDDFALLGQWLAEPHVAHWWNHDPSPAGVEDDFGDAVDGNEPGEDHLVLLDERPIGLMQYCRFHDDPSEIAEMEPVYPVGPGAAEIDYLIGDPTLVGQGMGTAMIRAFVEEIWATRPEISEIVVPVNSANVASWRALLAAGFHLAARGELAPDHPDHDPMHEILRLDRPDRPDGPASA